MDHGLARRIMDGYPEEVRGHGVGWSNLDEAEFSQARFS